MRQSVANVLREVAEKHGLSVELLLGPSRCRDVAWPRQEAMYRVFTECGHISFPEAGRRLGGRHHTTIYWGVRQHCKRIGVSYEHAQELRYGPSAKTESFIRAATDYGHVMEICRAY